MTSNQAAIWDYLTQLAEADAPPAVESLFQGVLDLLEADGVGVCGVDDAYVELSWFAPGVKLPDVKPRDHVIKLAQRLRTSLAAEVELDESGAWLACFTCEPRFGNPLIVWLYHRAPHEWSAATRKLWPMVGQMLVRLIARPGDGQAALSWLRRDLEYAAVLTSRLSHDFGNFLTGILGFTELSMGQMPHGTLSHRYLKEVLQSAQQGAAWVRRLAWFCRRSTQSTWPSELTSAIEAVQSSLPEGNAVHWTPVIPPDLPLLGIDGASLQTALEEVAKNACAAGNGHAALAITARSIDLTEADCGTILGAARPGKYVEIALADDGPGFSAEARAKLFREPFYSSMPRQRGLGLLLVYGIAYRFGGGVRLAPAEPGRGACVQLYFLAVALGTGDPQRADAPHVLVVHPDRLVSASLRKLLEGEGCRVTVAPNSMVALSMYLAPNQTYALVLAESMLPQLSGFDLARRILDRDAKARFLFLHTSASFHGANEQELLKRFVLLRWPIALAEFLQAVRTVLA